MILHTTIPVPLETVWSLGRYRSHDCSEWGGMSQQSAPPGRRIGRKIALATIALLAAGAAYAFFPRHADLRAFDPAAMARAETAMWRDYYEQRYVPLFLELYGLARIEQGFSPWDSFSLALNAARAAKNFQPSRSRADADA